MSNDYFIDRNRKNLRDLNEILDTLPSFCSVYFIGMSTSTSPLTRLNYARDLRLFFNYLVLFERPFLKKEIKNLDISDLNKVDNDMIERFLMYLSSYDDEKGKIYTNTEKGKSRKLSALRSFFSFFFIKNLITSNVASKVRTPKIHTKDIIRLEDNEVKTILDTSETLNGFSTHQQKYNEKNISRDYAILTLFLGTGIRVSELVGLNIEDIDFAHNSFKVTRKGGNQAILYFSDEVKEPLLKYMEYRESLNLPQNEKALFISMQGKRLGVRAVENLVKKYALIASPLKKISPHKLRSTYGTNLYRSSNDIYMVAEVLGHKDVNTTKKHYAAITEDIRKSAASKVKLR